MAGEFVGTAIEVLIIIVAAGIFGELFRRMGQSVVLGELVVGIALGPAMLGFIHPQENEIIKWLAEIGILFFLFEAGLETKVKHLLSNIKRATVVAILGAIFSLTLGFLLFYFLSYPVIVSVFVGATLTATSVGVTIRVFSDMRRISSPESRIILGAAVIDDILGLLLLSFVVGIGQGKEFAIFDSLINMLISLAVLGLVVAGLVKFVPFVTDKLKTAQSKAVLRKFSFVFCLGLAILAWEFGLALIVGAFIAGLILERTRETESFIEDTRAFTDILGPIFFVSAGALFNPWVISSLEVFLLVGGLLLVAVVGKLLSGLGAIRSQASWLAVGIGMIPRGEVGLVFLTSGALIGVLNESLYGILLAVIVLTTFLTPLFLKPVINRKKQFQKEQV